MVDTSIAVWASTPEKIMLREAQKCFSKVWRGPAAIKVIAVKPHHDISVFLLAPPGGSEQMSC